MKVKNIRNFPLLKCSAVILARIHTSYIVLRMEHVIDQKGGSFIQTHVVHTFLND